MKNQRHILRGPLRLLVATGLLSLTALAWAQQPAATVNWKDADIRQVVEAVSAVTGKNVILDPRVTGKVTLLSPTPLGPDEMYEAFLSILQVHGYVAIESDNLVKVVPDATLRQLPSAIGAGGAYGPDDLATQVVQLKNVGATQLVSLLRPLLPQNGHLVAHAGSNMLIISDRAANVARVVNIIRRIDQASDEDIEVVSLQHASAGEIVRIMTALTATPRADGAPVTTSLVADARTNSVLIGGDKNERLRLRTLIAHLDTPLEDGGDTQVRYLRYADAEELATKLQQHFTSQTQSTAGQAATATGTDGISVWADTQTNAL
ncbi:MAG: type II secretion system protein GspD, partial [Gammaproteobacteria bacterium]|nr:type II secretion system protein GspD [Gammaproteobacteria bacterium]